MIKSSGKKKRLGFDIDLTSLDMGKQQKNLATRQIFDKINYLIKIFLL